MKRRFDPAVPELMDRPQPVTPELKRDLQNLRQLNRHLGGHRIIRHFLRRWARPGANLTVADLATGSGDVPRLIADYGRACGLDIRIDAVDRQASTVEIARSLSAGYPEITYHCADILKWGEPDAYDIVMCSLALHHFGESDAIKVLQHCRSLSRQYVLVADLRRSWFTTIGVWLLTAFIYREPMIRFDARVSAARAFSGGELRRLAEQAGWKNFFHARFRYARQAIWLEAPQP